MSLESIIGISIQLLLLLLLTLKYGKDATQRSVWIFDTLFYVNIKYILASFINGVVLSVNVVWISIGLYA